jgi:modulator of FtsH protease HflK
VSTLLLQRPEAEGVELSVVRNPVRKASHYRLYLGVVGLWLLSGIFLVPADQQAVVTRFGAVDSPRVSPGIHYALPLPIDAVYKLKTHQLRRTVIGGDIPDTIVGRLPAAPSEFLSGDQNLLNVRVVVQYSVSQPTDFLFQTEDVDRVVEASVESELAHRIAFTPVDKILTTEKVATQNDVLLAAQHTLEEYRCGVILSSINIESVTPPSEAAEAFRSVAGARADAIRLVNEAEGYANDLIPRARGEAVKLEEQAQAYQTGRINRAAGDAARFEAIASEYAKAPKVTSTRAYVEAMEQILPKIKKLIVDSNGQIDLTVVGRDQNTTSNPTGPAQK